MYSLFAVFEGSLGVDNEWANLVDLFGVLSFGEVGDSSWGCQWLLHSHAFKRKLKEYMQRQRMQCIICVQNCMTSLLEF
jgi:hypothetical protein